MATTPDRTDLLYAWLGCNEKAGEKLWFGTGPLGRSDPGLRADIINWARRKAEQIFYADYLSKTTQWGCVERAILEGMMPRTKDPDRQTCWNPLDPPPDMDGYRGFVESELYWRIFDEMKATYNKEVEGGARDYYRGASRELGRYAADYSGIEGVEDLSEEGKILEKPDKERHGVSIESPLPDEDIIQQEVRQERRALATSLAREFRVSLNGVLRTFVDLIIDFLVAQAAENELDIEVRGTPSLEDVAPVFLTVLEGNYNRFDDLTTYITKQYASKYENPDNTRYQHTYRVRREKWMPFKEETHHHLWQKYRRSFQS